MPYGLPGLDNSEHRTLTRWLEQGARYEGPPSLPAPTAQRVALWERYSTAIRPGAAVRPLCLRASLSRQSLLRRRGGAPFLQAGAFDDASGSGVEDRCQPATCRRPGRRARLLPARRGARNDRRQDAHAVRAERRADGALARAVHRRPLRGRAPPRLRARYGGQPVSDLRSDPRPGALSLHAGRGRLHASWASSRARCAAARSRST